MTTNGIQRTHLRFIKPHFVLNQSNSFQFTEKYDIKWLLYDTIFLEYYYMFAKFRLVDVNVRFHPLNTNEQNMGILAYNITHDTSLNPSDYRQYITGDYQLCKLNEQSDFLNLKFTDNELNNFNNINDIIFQISSCAILTDNVPDYINILTEWDIIIDFYTIN